MNECPLIEKRDYEEFRKLLPKELPQTYHAWESEQRQEITSSDATFSRVVVKPTDFAEWCESQRCDYTLKSLYDFVRRKTQSN
jgi:hypothetical protein